MVKSHLQAETNPWTEWKICNGKLLLNKDTSAIDNLGADSLYLENKEGIFGIISVKNKLDKLSMQPFKIHILGCGSALPTMRHYASSRCRNKR